LEQPKKTLVFCYGWNIVSRSLFFMAFKTHILYFFCPSKVYRPLEKKLALRSFR
jgi:hypothetical protein